MHNYLKKWNINTSHFTGQGWNVKLNFKPKREIPIEELLVYGKIFQAYKLKLRLLKAKLKKHQCEKCRKRKWLKQPIPLELHHIDGDKLNNNLNNLLLLCPNCHAQTNNYRGRNIGSSK